MAGYPTLTYPDLLENSTREELEQILSLLQGYLSTEHKDDGTHKDVTADSLDVSGASTFGEDITVIDSVTAQATATANELARIIGTLNTGRDASGPALVLQGSASANDSMALVCSTAVGGPQLKFVDLASGTLSYIMRMYLAAGGSYTLAPSVAMNAGPGVDLGANASGERFANIYGLNLRANTAFYERSRTTPLGEWIAVAHSAGNFTAASGTWTVDSADQITYAYTLIGKTMTLAFSISNTDVSATPANLRIAIPGSFTAARVMRCTTQVLDAGTAKTGVALVNAAGTYVELYPDTAGSAWTATSGDNTSVHGTLIFEVS